MYFSIKLMQKAVLLFFFFLLLFNLLNVNYFYYVHVHNVKNKSNAWLFFLDNFNNHCFFLYHLFRIIKSSSVFITIHSLIHHNKKELIDTTCNFVFTFKISLKYSFKTKNNATLFIIKICKDKIFFFFLRIQFPFVF
jgi:hypothetical protein